MSTAHRSDRFEVNAPAVVSEIIDGEAVIMNLKSGHYFSIQGSGTAIWDWIGQGHSVDAVLQSTRQAFIGEAAEIENNVIRFINELLHHELIRPGAQAEKAPDGMPSVNGEQKAPAPFEVPVVEVFNDMQDLLLLDPIHDVDEAGWPRLKEEDRRESP